MRSCWTRSAAGVRRAEALIRDFLESGEPFFAVLLRAKSRMRCKNRALGCAGRAQAVSLPLVPSPFRVVSVSSVLVFFSKILTFYHLLSQGPGWSGRGGVCGLRGLYTRCGGWGVRLGKYFVARRFCWGGGCGGVGASLGPGHLLRKSRDDDKLDQAHQNADCHRPHRLIGLSL